MNPNIIKSTRKSTSSSQLQQRAKRAKSRSFGFTLIEVMLAMAVLAIAGVALVSATSSNVRHIGQLEERMVANWVASNQLVEVNLDETWPPRNNKKGKMELASKEWFWQQKVVRTTDSNMRAVTIEVRLNEDDELPITSLQTYIARDKG
ncbi:type II secretion system minor pseudopilin GspI [Endozoicomonas sp. G2_1]|uniref:type II secretion system minor pseudopilin GspI n=1 Tax=Endozoicomonas sp. G2_1 TaxID=2821091 RepID=UPI001AD954F7|nr:type II secretion system minor pseudopilin GspI [Endozoicomonas sp. G2_1]MBO9491885.1 type II secretion system minor pseudopilin GspI [Endozoicomonas sp. G2_1]